MKELEDFDWFPSMLRNFQTEFIGFAVTRFNFYKPFIEYLKGLELVQKPLTDLCSGSGEPAISIFKQSACFSSLLLTDKYPDILESNDIRISYHNQSADILQLEFKQDMYYTLFNSFHHFTDDEKLQIVKKTQAGGATTFCVEVLEPTVLCLLKVVLTTTIGCLLLTPFIHPFSFGRLFFTYIVPVNILTLSVDGIVSVLKSRSEKQYTNLFAQQGQTIRVQRFTNGLSPIIVIHIHPIQ